jgi:hypothetical protein
MWRTILSAVGVYVFIGLLIAVTDQLFADLLPGFSSMKMPPAWYLKGEHFNGHSLYADRWMVVLGAFPQ